MPFKKLIFWVLFLSGCFSASFAFAESPKITLFYGEECPHCHSERAFLDELKNEMPDLQIEEFEVWHNEENRKLFLETAEKLGIGNLSVPITIVGDKYLIGFDSPEGMGQTIRQMIEEIEPTGEVISHPIFGKINVEKAALPLLTVVLGTLDGFNPCSMWSLIVLLTLVIATGSRKKVWLAGGVFIAVSFISYFLFMSAWLNAFIWLEYIALIRIIVGIIAIVAGVISLKEFFTFKPDVCEASSSEKQEKITEKIKKIVLAPSVWALVLGVVGVAFSVNLIELLCSLGIPVVFTKALAMHNLITWKYYAYIGFYDFFYMLDDIAVLLIAGFSMKFLHLNSKYSKWSRLAAGILMLILGLVFLLKPELLMLK
ncbi:hypothetical protein KKD04_02035 [Patescibacteria group bacterium]|nr:hypothetical protein [Patescibacteria group bacterium]